MDKLIKGAGPDSHLQLDNDGMNGHPCTNIVNSDEITSRTKRINRGLANMLDEIYSVLDDDPSLSLAVKETMIDRSQVREWYEIFKSNNETVEVRIVFNDGKYPRVKHQRFNNSGEIIRFLEGNTDRPHHCYWTLNQLSDKRPNQAAEDIDVSRREWLLIDLDPERLARTSSTDAEKKAAYFKMISVKEYLDSKGWPEPCMTDSGNGYHLYYKLDSPNEPEITSIVDAFLHSLSNMFSDEIVKVDTTVSNPSRISKIPGTWAVKGESTAERPHRMSKIIAIPSSINTVEIDKLKSIVEDDDTSVLDVAPLDQANPRVMETDKSSDDELVDKARRYVQAVDDYVQAGGSLRFYESDWLSLGYAFKSIGPSGKELFHQVFKHHPDYYPSFAESEYNRLKPRILGPGQHTQRSISIATFFRWCHIQGIRPESDKDDPSFPFQAFPSMIQDLVESAYSSRLKFPKIYTSCGILCAASCAIGNTYAIEFTRGHVENAVIYIALVGGKGKNKSHPLSMALRPLQEMDDTDYQDYISRMSEYKANQDLPKKEQEIMEKPIRTRRIVDDITAEALSSAMSENPRGLMLYNDELIGWIKAQNQYRDGNGADAEMWLSLWSGKSHDVTRKTSEGHRITRPFVSVCGTIQPSVIPTLAKNREANGFLDRILFAWPQDIKIEAIRMEDPEMDAEILEEWSRLIQDIASIPYTDDPRHVRLSPEAESMYIRWQNAEAEKCNDLDGQRIRKTDDVSYNGIHAKMESYCLRLSLILEVLNSGCERGRQGLYDITEISPESMAGALDMCGYFTSQAIEIRGILDSSNTDLLAEDKKRLYHELPDEFTTAEGQIIAKNRGFPERTYKRFINDRRYFKHVSRGKYEKIY